MLSRTRISRRALLQRSAIAAAGTAVAGMTGTTSIRTAMATGSWSPSPRRAGRSNDRRPAGDDGGRLTNITTTRRDVCRAYCRLRPRRADAALRPHHRRERRSPHRRTTGQRTRSGFGSRPAPRYTGALGRTISTSSVCQITAGSIALANNYPLQDATLTARLRDAGAIILGKTNLSEWANFRGFQSSSGWSGIGRQTKNPYYLTHNPCGSSAGSGAAISANLAAVALGTETDGSIVCPSTTCGLVGIKPTVGLTSRAGVIPISHSQDTVGPMARTVADAAAVLGALAGPDPRDPMTAASADHALDDYLQFLDEGALAGARIGVPRTGGYWGYSPEADAICNAAIERMRELGAEMTSTLPIFRPPKKSPAAQQNSTFFCMSSSLISMPTSRRCQPMSPFERLPS